MKPTPFLNHHPHSFHLTQALRKDQLSTPFHPRHPVAISSSAQDPTSSTHMATHGYDQRPLSWVNVIRQSAPLARSKIVKLGAGNIQVAKSRLSWIHLPAAGQGVVGWSAGAVPFFFSFLSIFLLREWGSGLDNLVKGQGCVHS